MWWALIVVCRRIYASYASATSCRTSKGKLCVSMELCVRESHAFCVAKFYVQSNLSQFNWWWQLFDNILRAREQLNFENEMHNNIFRMFFFFFHWESDTHIYRDWEWNFTAFSTAAAIRRWAFCQINESMRRGDILRICGQ